MNLMREFYRNSLTERGKYFYDKIVRNISMLASKGVIEISGSFSEQDLKEVSAAYLALKIDRPEYYFMDNKVVVVIPCPWKLRITQNKRFTEQQIHRINKLLREDISDILEKSKHSSVLIRERNIYREIIKGYRYKVGEYSFDLSGLMVYRYGVCEALSGLLVLALRESGIPAIKIHGTVGNELHCWAMAWINQIPYHLDVTWDMNASWFFTSFKYFNLTEEEISRDHIIQASLIEYQVLG